MRSAAVAFVAFDVVDGHIPWLATGSVVVRDRPLPAGVLDGIGAQAEVAQVSEERFVNFLGRVAVDGNGRRPAGLPRAERQSARGCCVVRWCRGGVVGGVEIDGDGLFGRRRQ